MEKTLRDILREHMQAKGLTVQKLRQQTGIAERYLTALIDGESERLPAAPYIRGYLVRLGTILDVSGQDLWELYKKEGVVKSSGSTDQLPYNRFALKQIRKSWLIGGIVACILIFYFILNFNRFLGRPEISILEPADETTFSALDSIMLKGNINRGDKLFINGDEITLSADGSFEYDYKLDPGLNQIEFSVKKFLGRTRTEIRQVIYELTP
jgi:hypothetical protein